MFKGLIGIGFMGVALVGAWAGGVLLPLYPGGGGRNLAEVHGVCDSEAGQFLRALQPHSPGAWDCHVADLSYHALSLAGVAGLFLAGVAMVVTMIRWGD